MDIWLLGRPVLRVHHGFKDEHERFVRPRKLYLLDHKKLEIQHFCYTTWWTWPALRSYRNPGHVPNLLKISSDEYWYKPKLRFSKMFCCLLLKIKSKLLINSEKLLTHSILKILSVTFLRYNTEAISTLKMLQLMTLGYSNLCISAKWTRSKPFKNMLIYSVFCTCISAGP
jgi:hypothetical protein